MSRRIPLWPLSPWMIVMAVVAAPVTAAIFNDQPRWPIDVVVTPTGTWLCKADFLWNEGGSVGMRGFPNLRPPTPGLPFAPQARGSGLLPTVFGPPPESPIFARRMICRRQMPMPPAPLPWQGPWYPGPQG